MSDSQNAGFGFTVSTGMDASIFAVNQLPDVFGIVKEKLQQAATNDGLFAQIFGDKANTAEFQAIRHSWAIGDFSQLPSVQVVSSSTLNGAAGAFGISTQTIYLSDANLTTGSPPQDLLVTKAKAWVEEIGHYLDAKVGQDTAGDEGERFKNSVFGVQLSADELNRIDNEDDHGSIFANGQEIAVEFAGSPSDFGININSASYTQSGGNVFRYGVLDQCTEFAFGRALEKGLISSGSGVGSKIRGNAGDWDNQAGSWSSQARENSIVVWDPNQGGAGGLGHVAFVERVNANGSFVISEYNWNYGDGKFNSRTVNQGSSAFNTAKFIYLGSNPPPPPPNPTTSSDPEPIRVLGKVDFNGDGRADFLRQEKGAWDDDQINTANVFLSQGNGSFTKITLPEDFGLSSDNGAILYVADFNGDGKSDILRQEKNGWATDRARTAEVMYSNGNGTFSRVTLPEDFELNADNGVNLYLGDFNGDGKADILRQEKNGWSNDRVNTANVLLSNGYSFSKIVLPEDFDLNGNLTNLYMADFNGDGRTDFLRQEKGAWDDDQVNTANVFLSQGNGSFSRINLPEWFAFSADNGVNLYIGDFNGDGRSDILRQEKNSWDNDSINTANVFLSQGNGSFSVINLPEGFALNADNGVNLYIGDFNGDGRSDILRQEKNAWASDRVNTANVLLSQGNGAFTNIGLPEEFDLKANDGVNLFVADYNGDGKSDILRQEKNGWAGDRVNTANVLLSQGNGAFTKIGLPEEFDITGNLTNIISGQTSFSSSFTPVVRQLYLDVLNREPDQDGLQYWVGRMASGMTLPQIRSAFANGQESRNNVNAAYLNLLLRNADAGGLQGYVNALANGSTLRQVYENIANSNEARSNFWTAQYYNNTDRNGSVVFAQSFGRTNTGFDRNWGYGSPSGWVSSDNFSARIFGQVSFAAGLQEIRVGADDGVRVRVNGQTVIDRLVDQAFTTNTAVFNAGNGGKFNVEIEYYERGSSAALSFSTNSIYSFTGSTTVNGSSFGWDLSRYNANGKTKLQIDPNKQTVVVTHGRVNNASDGVGNLEQLARTAASTFGDAQVIFLDWRNASADSTTRPTEAGKRIGAVANSVTQALKNLGLTNANNLYFYGHSLGSLLLAKVAENYGKIAGFASLDPAFTAEDYDLDNDGDTWEDELPDISSIATRSISLVAEDIAIVGAAGDNNYAMTAQRAFIVDFGGYDLKSISDAPGKFHNAVVDVFTGMLRSGLEVNLLATASDILDNQWGQNASQKQWNSVGNYNADGVINARFLNNNSSLIVEDLLFLDSSKQRRTRSIGQQLSV